MRKKHTKFILGLLILIMCIALVTPIALAEEPVNVFMPSASIRLTGAPQQEPEEFEIILKADNPEYPMPETSVNGEYNVIVLGGDMFTFPAIQFSSIGTYTYTIYQTPGTNELGNYDDNVFHITVYITNAPGDGGMESTVIVKKDDQTEKLEYIEFVNDYEIELPDEEIPGGEVEIPEEEEPDGEIEIPDEEIPGGEAKPKPTDKHDKSDVPKTGDNTVIWPYILSFIGAGILILVLVLTRKSKVKE